MKTTFITMIGVLSLFLNTSCKKQEPVATFDPVAAKAAVEERSKDFVEAMNNKDSVGLANCYTKDAKFMQPNGKAVEGRANIQKLFGQWMKAGMPQFAIQTIEVWGDDNTLTAEENWSFIDITGKTVDTGKSLELFKKEDGVWKLHRDCYNSDMPPAAK
ncbi:SgcJ/EcaC family oxidoreductase [Flavobacterium sp.]|uniref:YybH family protein n=1 Tax=Flavobacterium sp. TaxID=239 RepID=UPI00286ACCC9|nr:SgcJ/EcaC family oxidoreductase [Flavobacterium sp.]